MVRKKHVGVCFLPSGHRYEDVPGETNGSEATLEVVEAEEDGIILDAGTEAEDEREIRRTIYELFHSDIRDIPLLTPEEEQDLSRRIQEEGDKEAFDRFVLGNLRLVIACAKKVKDRMGKNSILSFMDLIQEGVLGLMTAVSRFDYKRNTRFSTYGISWIYQRMKMAMLQHRHGLTIPGYACTSVHVMSDYIRSYRAGKLDDIPEDVDLEHIQPHVQLEKRLTKEAPFYVLGPLPTDIAAGYDHIAGAIGGALAGAAGADFLCYVTPAEHLGLPDEHDVYQGVMASRIAAHVADLVKGVPGAAEKNERISRARGRLDWEAITAEALDPELVRMRSKMAEDREACTMCGKLCAVKLSRHPN